MEKIATPPKNMKIIPITTEPDSKFMINDSIIYSNYMV